MDNFNIDGTQPERMTRASLPVYVPAEDCVRAWVMEYKRTHSGNCPSLTWIANMSNVPRSTCHDILKKLHLC